MAVLDEYRKYLLAEEDDDEGWGDLDEGEEEWDEDFEEEWEEWE